MEQINLSLQIIPIVEDSRVYPVVDAVIEMIRSSGVVFTVGPMETTMEGPMDKLFKIAMKAHAICLEKGARRVLAVIKTDCKPEGVSIEEKIFKYK